MNAPADCRAARLTHREIEHIRNTRYRSMLLFITDRCPVGCAHCSVNSRRDSPTISDFGLFGQIVEWMCTQPQLEVIGISGGEPFAERRGLTLAAERFASAGKRLVIFTSGVWARANRTPFWIQRVLTACSSIYLSTDAFHARSVQDSDFVRAARTIVAAGNWLIVQVLDHDRSIERVERLLGESFGDGWRSVAETNLIKPLTSGRGADVFTRTQRAAAAEFGPCPLARSPMVRYDGLVTACCNESVIMGGGPSRLRQQAHSADEINTAVGAFHSDALLRVIGDRGLGILTDHPALKDLGQHTFTMNCEFCWKVMERLPDRSRKDPLVEAINGLEFEHP